MCTERKEKARQKKTLGRAAQFAEKYSACASGGQGGDEEKLGKVSLCALCTLIEAQSYWAPRNSTKESKCESDRIEDHLGTQN